MLRQLRLLWIDHLFGTVPYISQTDYYFGWSNVDNNSYVHNYVTYYWQLL